MGFGGNMALFLAGPAGHRQVPDAALQLANGRISSTKGYRLRWPKKNLTRCPELVDHYNISHSLRRGFATWATVNGWDLKTPMTQVGWKDIRSVMRYIDPAISFGGMTAKHALELNTGTWTQLPAFQ
jgi:integrase